MDVEILKYYSRKDVQKKILESAKDREIGVKYGKDGGFGKRPDVLQFDNDILELVKGGATSFHVSEERWKNPLLIQTGMNKASTNNSAVNLEYSKNLQSTSKIVSHPLRNSSNLALFIPVCINKGFFHLSSET